MFDLLEKKSYLAWFAVIFFALIIFLLSSIPSASFGEKSSNNFSIIYHFLVFFWLGFFLVLAFVSGKRKNLFFPAIFLALFYAVLDEFHQLFVSGRSCSFSDFMIDSSGIFLAVLIYMISLRTKYD